MENEATREKEEADKRQQAEELKKAQARIGTGPQGGTGGSFRPGDGIKAELLEIERDGDRRYGARLTLICALLIATSEAPVKWPFWCGLLLAWLLDTAAPKAANRKNRKEQR
jgi:hypothetical protein